MKTFLCYPILCSALVLASQCVTLGADTTPAAPASNMARKDTVLVTITASVDAIDPVTREVTLKGPMGNYLTARVADPANLTQMRIGETIVVTYTEALAISLGKAKKKSAG